MGSSVYLLTVLSSLLMGLSQHPIGYGFISMFSLVPVMGTLCRLTSYREAIKIGITWGIVFNLTSVYWLSQNIGAPPPVAYLTQALAVLILTTIPVTIFLIWCRLNRRGFSLVSISLIWPSVELLRSFGSLAFPWVSLSNSLTEYTIIIQNIEYVGMYGLTFWIVLVNIYIYKALIERDRLIVLLTLFIIVGPSLSGSLILSWHKISNSEPLRISCIQPNIHLSEKWEQGAQSRILSKIISQSKEEISSNPDIIVWPETSTVSYVLNEPNKFTLKRIMELLGDSDISLIAGIPHYERRDGKIYNYNSAAYFDSSGLVGLYHKINLVPGAEYVPLSDYISSLDVFNFGLGNFSRGDEFTMFSSRGYDLATMICFESVFPYLSREFVRRGANVLIYIVNDGWYETAPEPQQHASRAVFRAIETRRPVVRCANTGISMVIDEMGNILHQIDLNKRGNISAKVKPGNKITFYVKYGDIFIYIMAVAVVVMSFKPKRYEDYV